MRAGAPTTVLVVDVHPVVREGVAAIMARHPGLAVVAQGTCGREAVTLWRRHRPDVTLLDLGLPDKNGIEVIAALRAEDQNARVIVFTVFSGVDDIVKALRAGARGYILKDASRTQLVEAVQTVRAGGRYLPATLEARLAEYLPGGELTRRELEVLECLWQGKARPRDRRRPGCELRHRPHAHQQDPLQARRREPDTSHHQRAVPRDHPSARPLSGARHLDRSVDAAPPARA